MIQQMLAIRSLVLLPFINPAWMSGSSRFTYCWSLAWRILSTSLLACEMSAILYNSVNILQHWLSLGLKWKLTLSSPVATAEFSKFAGILSAALSQHHLLGFEIAQLGVPSPPLALFVVMLPKAPLTSHFRISGSRWVITPLWLFESWRAFLYSSSVYSCHLFLKSSASVRSVPFLHFCPLLCPSLHEMGTWIAICVYIYKYVPSLLHLPPTPLYCIFMY